MTGSKCHTDRCGYCDVCEVACPSGAITITNGHPLVRWELCTQCGIPLPPCTGGNLVQFPSLEALLASDKPVVALVDPSCTLHLPEALSESLPGTLKAMGFIKVLQLDAFVSAVADEYLRLLRTPRTGSLIASDCPTVVSLIEGRFPQLSHLLAPIVSPMTAAARFARLAIPDALVVYFGPCIGKKMEVARRENGPTADLALTFRELQEFPGLEVSQTLVPFDTELIPGMPIEHAMTRMPLEVGEVLTVSGCETTLQILHALSQGLLTPKFVEIAFCGQCGISLSLANQLASTEQPLHEPVTVPDKEVTDLSRHVEIHNNRGKNRRARTAVHPRILDEEESLLLTPQESRVLNSLGQGLDNRAIAGRLFISENTVKIHLKNIYRKLGVNSRTQAVLIAASRGLIR